MPESVSLYIITFNEAQNLREWVPTGGKCRAVIGANTEGWIFLGDISTDDLIRAAQSVLAGHSRPS